MFLYLMRHGIAIDREDPTCPPDAERHLTRKGIEKTREVAEGLLTLGLHADAMISSPYVRAIQTAEIVAAAFGFANGKIQRTEALLPGAKPADVFKELSKLRGEELFCFGHAPNLDEVISLAVGARGGITSLKKAGVACIEFESLAPGHGTLVWICPPKVLRELGK